MGNKKGNKKPTTILSKKRISSIVLGLLVCLVVGGIYVGTKPKIKVPPVAPATGFLIETRPIMSDASFTGRIAEAYRIAAEIPKVIDSLFCGSPIL